MQISRKRLSGRVIDANGHPIANTAVSNGKSVVLTNADGVYSLRVNPTCNTHVFVTPGPGQIPLGWPYRPLAQWLQGDRDFVLRRQRQSPGRLEFTVVADPHLGLPAMPGNTPRWLAREVNRVSKLASGSSFTLAMGDLSESGTVEQLKSLRRVFDRADRPLFPLFGGGHDGKEERKILKTDLPWCRNYLEVMGPIWYSFEWGCCHFSVFANEDHHFTAEQIKAKQRWLWADLELAKDRGLVPIVVVHCPPSKQLARQLARRGVALVIHGHWHSLRHYRVEQMRVVGVGPMAFGGIDMMPRGFLQVEMDRTGQASFRHMPSGPAFKHSASKPRMVSRWGRRLGDYNHRAGICLVGDRIFGVANRDMTGRDSVISCLSASDGNLLWNIPTQDAIKHTPTPQGDRLYVTTQTGQLMCLAQQNGRTLWKRTLADYPDRWVHCAPVVSKSQIVIAGTLRGGLEAFDCATGKLLWNVERHPATFPTGSGDIWPWYATPLAVDKAFLVPKHGEGLFKLDAASGKTRWRFPFPYNYYMPEPLLWQDRIWCPSPQPNGQNVQLDAKTGQISRTSRSAGVPISWAMKDNRIYITVLDRWIGGCGHLQCRYAGSGRLLWQQKLGHDPADAYHYLRNGPNCQATPVISDNIVYQACTDGYLRLFDAQTGKPIRRTSFGSPLFSSPIVRCDRLWISTWSGHVYCMELRNISDRDG